MVTLPKNSRVIKRTRSTARFVRQTPNEKQIESPNRSQSFYRARYYDVTTGEFTSRDPLEYVDGMSLMRGYFLLYSADPLGAKISITLNKIIPWSTECGEKLAARHVFSTDTKITTECWWIQHVKYYCRTGKCADDCSCKLGPEVVFEFLEASLVDYNPETGVVKPIGHVFEAESKKESCGHRHAVAEKKIFCHRTAWEKIRWEWKFMHEFTFKDCNLAIQTGDYAMEINKHQPLPVWWDSDEVTPVDGPVSYDFAIDWHCCGKEGDFVKAEANPE